MADSATDVAADLAGLEARIRAAAGGELDRQADISKDAMAADTPRDRGITAESYVHRIYDGGLTHIGALVPGAFNPVTGEYDDDTVNAVWSGPVLVRPIGADQVRNFGDGPVSTRAYELTLIDQTKASAAVQVEHVVDLTSSQDDVDGLRLWVLDTPGDELSAHVKVLAEERQDG